MPCVSELPIHPAWSREYTSQGKGGLVDLVSLEALVLKTALPLGLTLFSLSLFSWRRSLSNKYSDLTVGAEYQTNTQLRS